jgi:hypothetical protein
MAEMTPEEKRRAAELLRFWGEFVLFESESNQRAAEELRDLAAKLEAEAGE